MAKRLLAAGLVLALAACTAQNNAANPPKTALVQSGGGTCYLAPDRGTAFGQALRRAEAHYRGKVAAQDIAMAGLAGLSTLDPRLAVSLENGKIVVAVPGQPPEMVTVGANPEASHLRERATDVVISARKLSPILAQTPHDRIQAVMAEALTGRYPTPDKIVVPCPPPKPQPAKAPPNRVVDCSGVSDMSFGQSKSGFPDPNPVLAGKDVPPVQQGGTLEVRKIPLQEPPEINAIQRGLVSQWVGGFINDGLSNWSAVDLDRKRAVFVQRRVFDERAQQSRPFADPVLPAGDNRFYARKWVTDGRAETEVVTVLPLTPQQIQAFVCIANEQWNQPELRTRMGLPQRSDTLQETRELRDARTMAGDPKLTRKAVPNGVFLGGLVDGFRKGAPTVDWPFLSRDGSKN